MGRREPKVPNEPTPFNVETVRIIEGLGQRLDQVEANQEEMKILRRMTDELNRRFCIIFNKISQ
eukprot:9358888-Prorocentrum_lima.AAC.1